MTDRPAPTDPEPGSPAGRAGDVPGGRRLVVGVGAPDRGDDAVGPAVVREVAGLLAEAARPPGSREAECVEREEPSALLDLWHGVGLCVVVDAVVAGAVPGTLHELTTGAGLPPLPERGHVAGTHDLGLGAAVELARALGRLPGRVVVVGVEAASFDHGAPLHPDVAAAVAPAAHRVLDLLRHPA